MPRQKIDQLTNYNRTEVQSQMSFVQEISTLTAKLKLSLTKHFQNILSGIDAPRLVGIIDELLLSHGEYKSDEQIQSHPSYTLITQLSLDMLGYHNTKVDADYGTGTTQGVKKFQLDQNLIVSGIADREFFELVRTSLSGVSYNSEKSKSSPSATKLSDNQDVKNETQAPTIIDKLNQSKSAPLLLNEKYSEDKESAEQMRDYIAMQCENVLRAPYAKVVPQIQDALLQLHFVHGQSMNESDIERIIWLIHKENPMFVNNRTSYTPIGQVGKAAWIDAYKQGLNIKRTNPISKKIYTYMPNYSTKDVTTQVFAMYGYMKLAGIFNAQGKQQMGKAYTKYNLGLYHDRVSRAKQLQMFNNQASEIKQYAHELRKKENKSTLSYENIIAAEYAFYAPGSTKLDVA